MYQPNNTRRSARRNPERDLPIILVDVTKAGVLENEKALDDLMHIAAIAGYWVVQAGFAACRPFRVKGHGFVSAVKRDTLWAHIPKGARLLITDRKHSFKVGDDCKVRGLDSLEAIHDAIRGYVLRRDAANGTLRLA